MFFLKNIFLKQNSIYKITYMISNFADLKKKKKKHLRFDLYKCCCPLINPCAPVCFEQK